MAENIYNQVVMMEAMMSFNNIIAPIRAMSYGTDNSKLNVGDVVDVPYSTPNNQSSDFSYSTGYGDDTTTLGVRPVTLNHLLYQKFTVNDCDASKLGNDSILQFGIQAGAKLAGDVISASLAEVITDANYPTSASCTSNQLTSSNAIADLVTQCDNANWTTANRSIINGASSWNYLIKNPNLNQAFSYGGTQVSQDGNPTNVMGFNTYKTTVSMPNNTKALVLHPTAMLFATGQHAPNNTSKNMVDFIPSTSNGITVTSKIFYDPYKSQTVYLLECLFGVAKGNPLALYQMK